MNTNHSHPTVNIIAKKCNFIFTFEMLLFSFTYWHYFFKCYLHPYLNFQFQPRPTFLTRLQRMPHGSSDPTCSSHRVWSCYLQRMRGTDEKQRGRRANSVSAMSQEVANCTSVRTSGRGQRSNSIIKIVELQL